MKHLRMLAIALALTTLCLVGCSPQPGEFVIRVVAQPQLAGRDYAPVKGFSGSYFVTQANGTSISRTIEGDFPGAYQVWGAHVSAVFQRRGSWPGKMIVTIERDGLLLNQADTDAEFGVVSVSY